jgi:hypothetical protein
MATTADTQLLHVMASMLPLSSSFTRENRWEAGVSNVLDTHLCKEDEDGNYVDDTESIAELDAADTALDGYDKDGKSIAGKSVRTEYENADETIGGPLYPTDAAGNIMWTEVRKRRRLHRRWQNRLRRLKLDMRAGKQQYKPDDLPSDPRPDMVEALSRITENGHHAPVSVRVRILTAYRIDRIQTHRHGVTIDTVTQCWMINGVPIPE